MSTPRTEDVVDALRTLVTFSYGQAGAYRELFQPVADQLGVDVPTQLHNWLIEWGRKGEPGMVLLTGNAGTGKTAAAQAYCESLGLELPVSNQVTDLGVTLVGKDLSGITTRHERARALESCLEQADAKQVLLCVNEGILRDACEDLEAGWPEMGEQFEQAMHQGYSSGPSIRVLNLNRQRITDPDLGRALIDFVTSDRLWRGCEGCPSTDNPNSGSCPMRANAEALRKADTQEALLHLVRLASGQMVPTIREFLSLLAYSICGDSSGDSDESRMWTCASVQARYRDLGSGAFSTSSSYYNLLFGAGVPNDACEESPLLSALRGLELGAVADLEIDNWLRDSSQASANVQTLTGTPTQAPNSEIAGSRSHLDRVRTTLGELTFATLGETLSISEEPDEVNACIQALVGGATPAQASWRRRVFFEAWREMQGLELVSSRLLSMAFSSELLSLARAVAEGRDVPVQLTQIVSGLNYLVTGDADASNGLVVPEPASLFARNPGSYRWARPAFVFSTIPMDQLRLVTPDGPDLAEFMNTDQIEVVLVTNMSSSPRLTIGPSIYQAIREAERFRGPVSHGVAEMTHLRSFYGDLVGAGGLEPTRGLVVADPTRGALVNAAMPRFGEAP